MKNIEETKNYFIKEIDHNILISDKQKKVCMTLNYIEQFLILASAFTGSILIPAFLLVILIGIPSFEMGLKICAITAGIKTYKPIIKK